MAGLLIGSGSDGGQDDERAVREVVADYVVAIELADPESACNTLTPAGREQIVTAVRRAPRTEPADDCEGSLSNLWAGMNPVAPPGYDYEARIRNGGDERFGPVPVDISGDTATVVLAPGRLSSVPLERVDGRWLVSNGTQLLDSFGVDPIE